MIEHLKNDFQIVEFNGSQLEVKTEVELTWDKGERPKFVLYLGRLSWDDLTVLKEIDADKIPSDKNTSLLYAGHSCLIGKSLPNNLGVIFDLPNSDRLEYCVQFQVRDT